MRYLLSLSFACISLALNAQALRDINFNYLYTPGETFTLDFKPVRQENGWIIFYKFQTRDSSIHLDEFSLQFELRESLIEKEGTALSSSEINETSRNNLGFSGNIKLPVFPNPKIIACKVIRTLNTKTAWFIYKVLDPNYPVDSYCLVNNEVLAKPYIKTTDKVVLDSSATWTVSYYNDNFPTALPPFAESQGRVSKGIKTDSTLYVNGGQEAVFSKSGLYLVQKDTSATSGISFRAEEDYPKFTKIQSLAGPLVYVCTKQEYDKLVLARNDKKAFDRIILSVTGDTDRARKFMRTYFRRVEYANLYFTSYKEGWKTDRGMIYIIFGIPDEVFKFSDREIWKYNNEFMKVTFNFSKSSSLFDPDNYVLIRENKYQQTWYEVIDLWRNARF